MTGLAIAYAALRRPALNTVLLKLVLSASVAVNVQGCRMLALEIINAKYGVREPEENACTPSDTCSSNTQRISLPKF